MQSNPSNIFRKSYSDRKKDEKHINSVNELCFRSEKKTYRYFIVIIVVFIFYLVVAIRSDLWTAIER